MEDGPRRKGGSNEVEEKMHGPHGDSQRGEKDGHAAEVLTPASGGCAALPAQPRAGGGEQEGEQEDECEEDKAARGTEFFLHLQGRGGHAGGIRKGGEGEHEDQSGEVGAA